MSESKYFPDLQDGQDIASVEPIKEAFSAVETDISAAQSTANYAQTTAGLAYDLAKNALTEDAADEKYQDKLTFDAEPTEDSTNPVLSGGIYEALSEKMDIKKGRMSKIDSYTNGIYELAYDDPHENTELMGYEHSLLFAKGLGHECMTAEGYPYHLYYQQTVIGGLREESNANDDPFNPDEIMTRAGSFNVDTLNITWSDWVEYATADNLSAVKTELEEYINETILGGAW